MMSALSCGSVSVANVCTDCSTTTSSNMRRYGHRCDSSRRRRLTASPHGVATPCRKASTISSGVAGSGVISGWVRVTVIARKRRAATTGSTRTRSGSDGEDRRQTRALRELVRTAMGARAERRDQSPDVHDVALHELGGSDEPDLEGLRRIDRRQPLLERLRIEGGLDHGLDQLVLVGEDVEDRPLRHAGALGDLLAW